jgi:hypothetical protein
MEGENRYLSKSQFAASQGWSASYITKLKDQGRLVFNDDGKLIDVPATLAILKRTQDPGKESVRQHHADERSEKHVGSHVKFNAPPGDDQAADKSAVNNPKYWDAKARREDMLADLAQLELGEKRGVLVDRKRVEAMSFAAGRMLRDAVLGLPTQLAPQLANMTDAFQIEIRLRDALRQVFADMAKMSVDDLDKAMEQPH